MSPLKRISDFSLMDLESVWLILEGSSVIDSWDGNIGNGKVDLQWTRDRNGEMTVSVDGDRVIEARDRSFKDPFDGFVMVNEGGDFAVDEVTVADNG